MVTRAETVTVTATVNPIILARMLPLLPHIIAATLTPFQWLLAATAAFGMGLSKAGLAGIGLFHVVVFAFLFGARESTGYVLPLLVAGDVCAVVALHQHVRWDYVRRMLLPACIGVTIAALFMGRISDTSYKPVIGWIVLTLALMQAARLRWSDWMGGVPHTRGAVWAIGLAAGAATMLANAAGPIVALYCVAVGLPKLEVVGTLAWFFFIINVFKLPFSAGLGLIRTNTLVLNAVLVPVVLVGVFSGRWIVHRLPQRAFDLLMVGFAAIAALRLIFS
jgi:uncharacterized protein